MTIKRFENVTDEELEQQYPELLKQFVDKVSLTTEFFEYEMEEIEEQMNKEQLQQKLDEYMATLSDGVPYHIKARIYAEEYRQMTEEGKKRKGLRDLRSYLYNKDWRRKTFFNMLPEFEKELEESKQNEKTGIS